MTEPPCGPVAADASLFEASFPPDPAAVSAVRRELRIRLRRAGIGSVADDIALVCQELMSNAVLHGCPDVPSAVTLTISVSRSDDRLRVGVRDPSEAMPTRQKLSSSRTSGRGLRLVDQLSERWGVETDQAGGKTVWAECALDDGASTPMAVELHRAHSRSWGQATASGGYVEGAAT